MARLRVVALLACVFVLGAWADKKTDNYLERRCQNENQRQKPECLIFCEKNPQRCWVPPINMTLLTQNRGQADSNIHIHVTTYNVGGINPPQYLGDWVLVDKQNPPDLIVIGLQEMVELSITTVMTGPFKEKKWVYALRKAIPETYDQIAYVRLVGVFLVVFKRKAAPFAVTRVGKTTVGTGIANFGNKGGAGISMMLNNFKLCIINSHLAAGQSNVQARNKDFRDIEHQMKFTSEESSRASGIYDHDVIIWMGDMNSRLNTAEPYEEVVHLVNINQYLELFKHDQLREQRQEEAAFLNFTELEPEFKPTYKFDPGTNTYDTSEKRRIPAWCDRILHWEKTKSVKIQQLTYISQHEVVHSDHKPVQSLFKLDINSGACAVGA